MKWSYVGAGCMALAVVCLAGLPGCGSTDEVVVELSELSSEDQFFELAARGERRQLEAILDARPQLVNARDWDGRTVLHYAAASGHRGLVNELLARGADPRAQDEDGNSPAEAAMLNAHVSIAESLRQAALASR